jgi:hypothetical protein
MWFGCALAGGSSAVAGGVGTATVLIARPASSSAVCRVEGQLRCLRHRDDVINGVGVAEADAWVLYLASVVVAVEDFDSDGAPCSSAGEFG